MLVVQSTPKIPLELSEFYSFHSVDDNLDCMWRMSMSYRSNTLLYDVFPRGISAGHNSRHRDAKSCTGTSNGGSSSPPRLK